MAPSDRTETLLEATREWGGVDDFHRAVRDLRAGESTPEATAPGHWRVAHAAGKPVEVRYSAVNDVRDPDGPGELDRRDFYRTMIGATWFHAFGHAILLRPEIPPGERPHDVCIAFEGLARDASFASSYSDGQREGRAQGRRATSLDDLAAALFVGGDFRLLRREVRGRPVLVALRGTWDFSDAQFADASAAIVSAHRAFWEDFDFPRFLLTLVPNRRRMGSTGGTGVTDAFAMNASNDFAVPGPAFEYLIAHEHLHTWIPRRIGAMGEGEAARYWFSEGFTNYLSHRLLVRSGLWDLRDYASSLNRVLLELAASPAASAPNARVAREFWTDSNVQRIPYLRGELVATLWARRLEAKGTSLESALRALRLPRGHRTETLAVDRLQAALGRILGQTLAADLASYVERGEALPIDSGFLGPCFAGQGERRPRFELGFDRESLKDRAIRGVVAGSAAQRAGLRDGMRLEGFSVRYDDPERDAQVKVREGETARTIVYRPVAADPLEVMVFAPKPAAGADPACRNWIER